MQSITTSMLGLLGLEGYQWILVVLLIGLIIFYMQYKKRSM